MEHLQDKWLRTEIQLNQKHEHILFQREELLSKQKQTLKKRELKTKRLQNNFDKAKERNQKFAQEIELIDRKIKKKQRDSENSKFELLKAKYWEMVMKELSSL